MSEIVKIYTNLVFNNLRPLRGNWEPGRPLELGDYGVLEDGIFIFQGNIKDDFGLSFTVREDPKKDQKTFSSKGSVDTTFTARVGGASGAVTANASLTIEFKTEEAVFFNAAECEYRSIANKRTLGDEILKLYDINKWKKRWVIVTDLIQAGATTIIISGGQSSSIVLEAKADVQEIDLAKADIGLTIKSQKNVGYQIIAQQGLIPLFGLYGVHVDFWTGEKTIEVMRSKRVKAEAIDREDVFFHRS